MDIFIKYGMPRVMFLFFLFCNIGWIQESMIESLYRGRWINRGFLKGPYIPIYGFGGIIILFCCMPFRENGFAVYLVGMLACTMLEYFVGWFMETIFHKQFWDYSMLKITYKNRISLLSSLFWGLLSLFMVYILFGIVDSVVNFLPENVIIIYDAVMMIAVCIDTVISISRHIHFRDYLKKFPIEKAKKLAADRFISLGGAVQSRVARMRRFILQPRDSDVNEFIYPEEDEADAERSNQSDL